MTDRSRYQGLSRFVAEVRADCHRIQFFACTDNTLSTLSTGCGFCLFDAPCLRTERSGWLQGCRATECRMRWRCAEQSSRKRERNRWVCGTSRATPFHSPGPTPAVTYHDRTAVCAHVALRGAPPWQSVCTPH